MSSGAFLGTRFPFPDNSHLRTATELWDADWVAVSSAQSDHLDSAFLAGLRDDVQVVIPAYPSPVLRDLLSAAGIANAIDGVSVLHYNDAELSLSQTRRAMIEVGGPLDLLALEASEPKFRAVKRLVRTVKPRLVMPYCAPPADDLPAETLTVLPGDSIRI